MFFDGVADLQGLDCDSIACTLAILLGGLLTDVRSIGAVELQEASVRTKIPWNILGLLTFYRI